MHCNEHVLLVIARYRYLYRLRYLLDGIIRTGAKEGRRSGDAPRPGVLDCIAVNSATGRLHLSFASLSSDPVAVRGARVPVPSAVGGSPRCNYANDSL